MGLRLRSIRQRIFLLVLVPVISLIALYLFATFITLRGALTLSEASTIKSATGQPAGAFLSQIDAERPLAVVYLSSPTGANLAMLQVQQNKTTAVAASLGTALNAPATMNNATAPDPQPPSRALLPRQHPPGGARGPAGAENRADDRPPRGQPAAGPAAGMAGGGGGGGRGPVQGRESGGGRDHRAGVDQLQPHL